MPKASVANSYGSPSPYMTHFGAGFSLRLDRSMTWLASISQILEVISLRQLGVVAEINMRDYHPLPVHFQIPALCVNNGLVPSFDLNVPYPEPPHNCETGLVRCDPSVYLDLVQANSLLPCSSSQLNTRQMNLIIIKHLRVAETACFPMGDRIQSLQSSL